MEGDLIPERGVKEISQASKIKDLYFDLLKSSKKEIMLIFPTNKAYERQERIGLIGLVKQVARDKNLKVRMLVPVENLENNQELVQEPFPLKENYQQDPSNNIYKIYYGTPICRPTRNYLNSR